MSLAVETEPAYRLHGSLEYRCTLEGVRNRSSFGSSGIEGHLLGQEMALAKRAGRSDQAVLVDKPDRGAPTLGSPI